MDPKLKIFRNHKNKAQPFVVGYKNDDKVIDQGGAYRSVLTDVMEELRDTNYIEVLKRVPGKNNNDCFILNERGQEDDSVFRFIGGLLAFSFLTRQPFCVDLADAVWKQIIRHKLEMEDLLEIDPAKYQEIAGLYPLLDDNQNYLPSQERDQKIQNYFAKYQYYCDLIREGMNDVLDRRIYLIAYLPLRDVKLRVQGRQTFTVEDLKNITKYQTDEGDKTDADNHKKWFWEIIEGFNPEMRAKYLKYVWGRDRLPSKIQGESHLFYLYMEKTEIKRDKKKNQIETKKWQRNSYPKSHTCTFQLDSPYFDSKAQFKEKLEYVIKNAQGISD